MGKFSKAGGREMPELNTSSLPDLVFAFLFFIMMVTSMREVTLKVEFHAPQATELQKLEKKSLVTFIYVGKPTRDLRAKMGSETRIQLNDAFAETSEIQDYIAQEKSSMKKGCSRTTLSFWNNHRFLVRLNDPDLTGDDAYLIISRYRCL